MRKLLLALAASTALLGATAASAQVSPYVESTVSSNLKSSNVDYGLSAGVSAPLNRNLDAFAEVGAENFADKGPTTFVGSVGLSARLAGPLSAYGSAGLLNTGGNDGLRLGLGLGLRLTDSLSVRGGVERDNYGSGVKSTQGTVGVSVRF